MTGAPSSATSAGERLTVRRHQYAPALPVDFEIVDAHGYVLATVHSGAIHDDDDLPLLEIGEAVAQTRALQMAAAPRLRGALQEVVRADRHALDECDCDDDCEAAISLWRTAMDSARAALLAAEPPELDGEAGR